MSCTINRAATFERELEDLAYYIAGHSAEFARGQFLRSNRILTVDLAETPHFYGVHSSSPAHPITRISFVLGDAPAIGLSAQLMRRRGRSTSAVLACQPG